MQRRASIREPSPNNFQTYVHVLQSDGDDGGAYAARLSFSYYLVWHYFLFIVNSEFAY